LEVGTAVGRGMAAGGGGREDACPLVVDMTAGAGGGEGGHGC